MSKPKPAGANALAGALDRNRALRIHFQLSQSNIDIRPRKGE
jgi:hypothetical protein